ncbi:hypothetical protein [Gilvimarinus polysaccharolyticus]|uniref:hypothetical protein n=1 Tax=Gilvimarinus polysaccharolyticus TaxID=863921 RepID=UPI0006733C56|nr:hypothetical protein [Gilvimarinus polysaccharolyticus]
MSRFFDVTLCGTEIFFDNYTEQAIIGFLIARRVQADSPEAAVRRARHSVLIDWNYTHNVSRKLGVPTLSTVQVTPVKKWLQRSPSENFYFFDSQERKQAHLNTINNSTRPWYLPRKK